ncbi:MAG: hypothetical protein AAFV78_05175, partial [Bacteroidota bacterium]
ELFEVYYPHYVHEVPQEVIAFANQFCQEHLQMANIDFNAHLVSDKDSVNNPVTEENWQKMYRSANPKRNQFFKELGIYTETPGHKVLTGSHMFFIGVYSFGGWLRKMWQSQVKR